LSALKYVVKMLQILKTHFTSSSNQPDHYVRIYFHKCHIFYILEHISYFIMSGRYNSPYEGSNSIGMTEGSGTTESIASSLFKVLEVGSLQF
jgi:hypothetical protein